MADIPYQQEQDLPEQELPAGTVVRASHSLLAGPLGQELQHGQCRKLASAVAVRVLSLGEISALKKILTENYSHHSGYETPVMPPGSKPEVGIGVVHRKGAPKIRLVEFSNEIS